MISLLFKFLGDSTPLKQEAEKAKGEMSKAGAGIGKEFGTQLKGAIMATIGISAIVQGIKASVAEAMAASVQSAADVSGLGVRETIALNRAEKASGMTREQILMTGREKPELFAKFIKQFEPGLSEESLKNAAETGQNVKGLFSRLSDSALSGLSDVYNRTVGLTASLYGSAFGNQALSVEGRRMLMTGQAAAPGKSPTLSFISANTEMRRSEIALNEVADNTNRLIEETQKLRQAVEKN
jgi:hypothetical protein